MSRRSAAVLGSIATAMSVPSRDSLAGSGPAAHRRRPVGQFV